MDLQAVSSYIFHPNNTQSSSITEIYFRDPDVFFSQATYTASYVDFLQDTYQKKVLLLLLLAVMVID